MVQEWLGDNIEDYVGFLINSEHSLCEDISKNFLEPGFFDCELGNSVRLALSNILRCPIVLFTTICDCPVLPLVLPLVPRLDAFWCPIVLFTTICDSPVLPLVPRLDAFWCPIVLFTIICDCPVLPLVPRLDALSAIPIYVAYHQSGSGHYDAVATCTMTKSSEEASNMVPKMESKPSEDTPPCSCGRGHSQGEVVL